MTKKLFSLFVLATFILTSCKKELVPQDSAEIPLTTAGDTVSVATEATNVQPTQTAVQQPQVATPAPAKVLPGMNPPHGQAGHDCAIAVGAPLNSKKTTPPAPATVTTTQTNATPSAPAILNPNATTAPGMNPPHGQAGHDCAVAVGAPLPKS